MIARLSPVVAGLACALGCAALAPPLTPPAEGGRPWRSLTSAHFEMKTDLAPADAREALASFEGIYDLFVDVAFADPPRGRRIAVVLFRREKDYRVLGMKGSDAYYSPSLSNDPEPEGTMVLFGGLTDATRITFQHELTHHLIRYEQPHIPVWLNEGTAQYYSTLTIEKDGAVMGNSLPDLAFTEARDWHYYPPGGFQGQLIPATSVPTVARLLAASPYVFYAAGFSTHEEPTVEERQEQMAFYGGAWALVHMLRNGASGYRRRFAEFSAGLSQGMTSSEAWGMAFGDVDPDRIESDFRAYLELDRHIVRVKPYTPRPPRPPEAERALSNAEVHLLWARLDEWTHEGAARAEQHIAAALAEEPGSPEAHFWRGLFSLHEGDDAGAERELREALAAAPAEPRYLLMQLRLAARRGARRPASPRELASLTDRLAQVARTATELDEVAYACAVLDRLDDGLRFAEQALQADPFCWRCEDTRALLLVQKDQPGDAAAAEERAIDLLPEQHRDPALLERLRKYQAAARTRAKKAPPR